MASLKLLTYSILFAVVLFIKPGSEFCFYNGSISIVDINHDKVQDDCAAVCHNDTEHQVHEDYQDHQDHHSCVDVKIIETHCGAIEKENFQNLKQISLPVLTHDFILALQNEFSLGQKEKELLNLKQLFYHTNDLNFSFQKSSAYLFTTTTLLLI